MNYVMFYDYKLALNTRMMVELERKLGRNPIDILIDAANEKMPKISDMVLTLWASAQRFNHGISLDDCYDIFDNYIGEGHSYTDFITVMMDIFTTSGLIAKPNEEDSNPNE